MSFVFQVTDELLLTAGWPLFCTQSAVSKAPMVTSPSGDALSTLPPSHERFPLYFLPPGTMPTYRCTIPHNFEDFGRKFKAGDVVTMTEKEAALFKASAGLEEVDLEKEAKAREEGKAKRIKSDSQPK